MPAVVVEGSGETTCYEVMERERTRGETEGTEEAALFSVLDKRFC